MEGFLTAAWVAGVVEGGLVLFHQEENKTRRLVALLPASVLYGTLALPLGLVGASPGPAAMTWLPFTTNSTHSTSRKQYQAPLAENLAPTPTSAAGAASSETTTSTATSLLPPREQRRVDLLRAENRTRHGQQQQQQPVHQMSIQSRRTQQTVIQTQQQQRSRPLLRYIATLDGQPLPSQLAEAMRRARFLLVGASLVLAASTFQDKYIESIRLTLCGSTTSASSSKKQELHKHGKDTKDVQEILSTTKRGAVLRWSSSAPQLPDFGKSPFVTLALYTHQPNEPTPNRPYWNIGNKPEKWNTTPISSDWFMRTKTDSRLLLVEADVTPTSLEQYFAPVNVSDSMKGLSKALQLFRSLEKAAKQIVPSLFCVEVILARGKPALPLRDDGSNVIYVDVHKGLSAQVSAALEELHESFRAELAAKQNCEETHDAAPPESSTIQLLIKKPITWVDNIGSFIRKAATWTVNLLKDAHDDYWICHRVVHVLSDQRAFVEFLQSSLQDWRIVWYDATNENDVQLYLQTDTEMSVVCCCSSDLTTVAFITASAAAKKRENSSLLQKTLAIILEEDSRVLMQQEGVRTVSIQSVHNNLLLHVRDLLANRRKTAAEVQELVDQIS